MTQLNAQCRLAARPVGLPQPSDWEYVEEPAPEPADGQFLVEVQYISLDPAMRAWMNAGRSYIPPVEIGEVMRAAAIGRVVESRHPEYEAGDCVSGAFGVQRFAASDGSGVRRVDTGLAPAPVHLGTLGLSGLTAYFGLLDIGRPEPGQTVVVSGAAGSVGSVVGQIARIKGARAVGIAGGPAKCEWLVRELGFDAAIDYKNESVSEGLKQHCPNGIDVYFENVGGEILDAVLARINLHARIPLCGLISQYNAAQPVPGPYNLAQLIIKRARLEGFLVSDYMPRALEAIMEMGKWWMEGKLKYRVDVVEGLEHTPAALNKLFDGSNQGKLIVKVSDEPA